MVVNGIEHPLKDGLGESLRRAVVTEQLVQVVGAKIICIEFEQRLARLATQPQHSSLDQVVGPVDVSKPPRSGVTFEKRGGRGVEKRSHIAVFLQERCGDPFRDGALERFDNDRSFVFTDRHQQDASSRQDGLQPYREGLGGNVIFAEEIAGHASPCDRVEGAQSRSTSPGGKRFVESNMAIHPDTQKDEVKASFLLNGFVKPTAMKVDVAGVDVAIQAVHLLGRNVHVSDQLLMKPCSMGLRAALRQSVVLIEKEQNHIRQIEGLFLVESDQLPEGRQWS